MIFLQVANKDLTIGRGEKRPDRASKPSFGPEKMAGQALSFDRGRPASLDALSQLSCDDHPFCVPSLSVS